MAQGDSLQVRFDAFELDEKDARLRRSGTPVALAPKAFAVLCALARKPGVLVTKSDLLDEVWGHQHVSESVLKTIISELRAALGDDAKQPRYIETASRRGYRFIAMASSAATSPGTAMSPAAATTLITGSPPAPREALQGLTPSWTAQSPPSLIGRDSALARLRQAWQKAVSGERQLIWIAGEAGIGKTSLIQTFLSELDPRAVTTGQCIEHFGSGEPYLPLLEAVKELCRREPALIPIMRAVAPTWLVQMPWLVSESDRTNLQREVAGAHQDRMVREMREMMDRYTETRPLVFVLEDLHWCDHGTLRMMEHFARRPRQVRILWLASFRLTQVIAEDHPLRELRQELRLHKLCEEILLEPFSETEVAAYMSERLPGTQLPERFVRRLHEHTEGLPLFVANVADTLIAQSSSDPTTLDRWLDAASTTPLPVPDSLSGVIDKQIGRLPTDVQAMLEAASVLGVEFRATAVAQMLGKDADWVGQQCDDLVRRKFWLRHVDIVELPDGAFDARYAFLHAVYQHVFYQRLSIPQRVQFHRRAAKWLETTRDAGKPPAPAELASHYERGHQPLQALRYYAEAAEIAVAHFAPREALDITTTALKLLAKAPDGPERMEAELALVHKRGLASGQLLGIGAADTISAFERARVLCDALPESPSRAVLLNGLGLSRYVLGDYPQARAIAERVRRMGERYGNPVLPMCAHLLGGMVNAIQAEHLEARASLEQGVALCEQMGEHIPFAHFVIDPFVALRTNLAIPLVYLGFIDQAREQIAIARIRAQELGQPTARMLVEWTSGMFAVRIGDVHDVEAKALALGKIVDASMLTQGDGPARWLRGWALAQLGSPREGFELIRAGYESHARLGMYAGNTETLGYAADALLLAGDLDGAERQLEEAIELIQRFKECAEVPNILLLSARLSLARGDIDGARRYMHEALAEARQRHAPYFEVKSLTALCELPAATDADRDALRNALNSLPEGRRTPFGIRADRLISA